MNVKSILCPVDFSDNSHFALDYAVTIAKESDAELHIVHCYADVLPYETGFGAAAVYETVDVDEEMARLKAIIPHDSKVRYRHTLIQGSPEKVLSEYAEENEIDLIVMGTHGRKGLARLVMGSVAESVLRHAPCPVITIRQDAVKHAQSSA
jgi:universal stress protein A